MNKYNPINIFNIIIAYFFFTGKKVFGANKGEAMFQLGSKFVGKGGGNAVWTVSEVVTPGIAYKGKLPDGTERVFNIDQMVSISMSANHKKGSF